MKTLIVENQQIVLVQKSPIKIWRVPKRPNWFWKGLRIARYFYSGLSHWLSSSINMYHLQYKWWLWCLWVNTGKRKQPNLFSKQKTDPEFWLSWICVHVLPFSFIANFPSIFRPSVAFSCDATGWSSVFMDWRWAKRLWWCLFSAWCLLTPIGIPLKPGTPSLLQKGLATRSSSSWKKSHKYIYIYIEMY